MKYKYKSEKYKIKVESVLLLLKDFLHIHVLFP